MNGLKDKWYLAALIGLFLILGMAPIVQSNTPLILTLGEDGYLPKGAIEGATGARFMANSENQKLENFQLIILSNIDYPSIPGSIREGLADYVRRGGSLLVTGGNRSYGSGGYSQGDLAQIIPFAILYPRDWQPSRRGLLEFVASSHPILSGLSPTKVPLIQNLNNLGQGPGSNLIAQFSKFQRQPLITEKTVGDGCVIGIAFDMGEVVSLWTEGSRFSLNLVRYLLERSKMGSR